jgi:hypothetical protein
MKLFIFDEAASQDYVQKKIFIVGAVKDDLWVLSRDDESG